MKNANRIKLLLLTLTILISSILLLLTTRRPNHETSKIHHTNHLQRIAKLHCETTLYKDLCVSTLMSTFPDLHKKSLPQVISGVVNVTVKEVYKSESNCTGIRRKTRGLSSIQQGALVDCLELLDETVDELEEALSRLSEYSNNNNGASSKNNKYHDDIQTALSGAMTNQITCLDGFEEDGSEYKKKKENVVRVLRPALDRISKHVSNSLAMLKKMPADKRKRGNKKDGFPDWMSRKDRRLLLLQTNETQYDAVVAKDGTGDFSTVSEAVDAAPNKTTTRFVIYIKAGTYMENVEVAKKKTNLMFIGDGIEKTVIKANRSVKGGFTTYRSATVAVVGSGFIAKGISFENTAGPDNHQAVALRSGSDLSAFYQCRFIGYQDTLYVHSLRQFYRECDVYGTVDFIFGNAAVVLQRCNLYARKPLENQKNMFTAQGRKDPNQNTGISIINSKVAADADLEPVKSSFKSYLGRPWKEYSRTVYIGSYIEDVIDPAGWHEWDGAFALDTLYYGEYNNRGPGSNTTNRVAWKGYRVINSSTEASQFTVSNFIEGGVWLPSYDIPFDQGLSV